LHGTKKKENQEGKNGKAGLPPEQVQHSAEQIMVSSSGLFWQITAKILTVINTPFLQFYANGCIHRFTEQASISTGCNNSPA